MTTSLENRENATAGQAEKQKDFSGRIRIIREKVQEYCRITFNELHIAGAQETEELLRGVDRITLDEKDVAGWELYIRTTMKDQIQSARKLKTNLEEMLAKAQQDGLLSQDSAEKWMQHFQDPSANYKRKEYFVTTEIPRRMENWRKTKEERESLLQKPAFALLSSEEIPKLSVFKDNDAFAKLSYKDKKDLVAMVSAAMLARNKFGNDLYHKAKSKLDSAVTKGILSPRKVGIWMERVFQTRKDKKTMQNFVTGTGKNSLTDLIGSWAKITGRFNKVHEQLQSKEGIARGFKRITLDQFLDMHYAQRVSYVNEAERVLGTAGNIKDENPLILEIRHYLDIGDWKGADDALAEANKESLSQVDRDRLFSMRQYLAQHRTDGGPKRVPSSSAEADAAWMEIQLVLQSELDPALRALVKRLLLKGNFAINALRWTVYNYIWCHKNGFVNQEDSFEHIENNIEATQERWEENGDAGRNDVMLHQAYKRDEQKMLQGRKGDKAWIQYVNLTNENVMAGVADFYSKHHDPKVLYWTTFMGCRGTEPLDEGWHQRQLDALNKIRSATRTIESSGGKYTAMGVKTPEAVTA